MNSGATGSGLGNKIPSGYKAGRMQNFSPEQMKLFQQMFSQVSPNSYTSRLAGGDQSMFEEMERPAMRQFAQQQGAMANRFSGMGMGGRQSSGFQNAGNQATSDFASDLQSKRQGLQRQAIQDLMSMSNDLLNQKPYENFMIKKQNKPSFMQRLIGGAAPIVGGAIGGMFGGPMGAMTGSSIGSSFGSAFSGSGSNDNSMNAFRSGIGY